LRWAETLLHPVVDWRQALQTSIRKGLFLTAGKIDYSYRRPSRRPVPNVILPSLVQPVPQVSVMLDTSGSMDDLLLIVLTDGYTPWPASPPSQPVIIGLVGDHAASPALPSWAKVIVIRPDQCGPQSAADM
jgi:predicted metal-dependent peptidase